MGLDINNGEINGASLGTGGTFTMGKLNLAPLNDTAGNKVLNITRFSSIDNLISVFSDTNSVLIGGSSAATPTSPLEIRSPATGFNSAFSLWYQPTPADTPIRQLNLIGNGSLLLGTGFGTSFTGITTPKIFENNTPSGAVLNSLAVLDGVRNRRVCMFLDDTNNVFGIDQSYSSTAIPFTIRNLGTEQLRLSTTGNLGINTNNPTEKLEVVGNVKATKFLGNGTQLETCIVKHNTTIEHTGTVDETIIYSQLIPAGTFQANDILDIFANFFGQNTANNKDFRVAFNTTAVLSGAKRIGFRRITTAGAGFASFQRFLVFKNSLTTQEISAVGTNSVTSYNLNINTAPASLDIDFTVDQYFIITAKLDDVAETMGIRNIFAKIIR